MALEALNASHWGVSFLFSSQAVTSPLSPDTLTMPPKADSLYMGRFLWHPVAKRALQKT